MLRGYVLCGAVQGSKGATEGCCLWGGVSLAQRPDWLFTAASHSAVWGRNIPGREHGLGNTLRWALNKEYCPGVSKTQATYGCSSGEQAEVWGVRPECHARSRQVGGLIGTLGFILSAMRNCWRICAEP